MADPVTMSVMAGVSMAGSAAGGILGAYGASQSAEASASASMYQAGISQLNKKIANRNAREAIRTGDLQAVQLGLKQSEQMGKIKAAQGATGIDMNSGSSVAVRDSQSEVNRMDHGLLRRSTQNKAYNYKLEAKGHDAQAGLHTMAADNAIDAGRINAISSLVGGATSVASKWTQASNTGMFTAARPGTTGVDPALGWY